MTEETPPPETPHDEPSTPAKPGRPWPLIVGLIVLGVVIVAATAAWLLAQNRPAPAEAERPAVQAPVAEPSPVEVAVPPGAIQGQPGVVYEWSQASAPEGVTYVVGDLTIRIASKTSPDGVPIPTWSLTTADGQSAQGEGVEGFSSASASFGVGNLDPKSPRPQLLFASYSGGAHCCTQITAVDFIDGRWREVDFAYMDGEPMSDFPRDVDGDGWAELVGIDNRFLYTFDGYAQSRAPLQITALRGGKTVDVSTDARYRKLYEKDLAELRKDCEDAQNSACAAYVATAARLGRTDEAWAVMLASYDREATWWPTTCRKPGAGGCPEGEKVEFGAFPDALRWFLGDNGYLPPVTPPVETD